MIACPEGVVADCGRLLSQVEVWVDPVPRPAAVQMAIDEALMRLCPGRVLLRHYQWDGQAASFGCSQSLAWVESVAVDRELVRRWTGGGLVFHGHDLTFSLLVPGTEALARVRPRESYAIVHSAVRETLQERGVACRLVDECHARSGDACFTAPAVHDLIGIDGRKLCGGAQRRTRSGFLHQGSIQNCLLPDDCIGGLARHLAGAVSAFCIPSALWDEVHRLVDARYGNPDWTSRVP